MTNILKHLGNLASGWLTVWGLCGIFTTGPNYLALPAIILGISVYIANHNTELNI